MQPWQLIQNPETKQVNIKFLVAFGKFYWTPGYNFETGCRGMMIFCCLENNGCLAVKPNDVKLTYSKTVRTKATVEVINHLIMNGLDPTNDLNQTKKYNVFVNKVDIKKK